MTKQSFGCENRLRSRSVRHGARNDIESSSRLQARHWFSAPQTGQMGFHRPIRDRHLRHTLNRARHNKKDEALAAATIRKMFCIIWYVSSKCDESITVTRIPTAQRATAFDAQEAKLVPAFRIVTRCKLPRQCIHALAEEFLEPVNRILRQMEVLFSRRLTI